MLRTVGLTRVFDGRVAVENLTLDVRRGEIFGLLGPNGAGKTTTVRMLCCLLAPSAGTATVLDYQVGRLPDAERIRARVGLLPEVPGLYERISAYRNLDFHAQLYGVSAPLRRSRIEALLKALGIWARRDDAVATFSRGMRQKLAIARALVHEPEVLFLDEPTTGLDPEAAITVRDMILDQKRQGRTIFLNTHNLDEAQRICDRIGIIKTRLVAIGSPRDLARQRFGRSSAFELREPSDAAVAAVRALGYAPRVDGRRIAVPVEDPDAENPRIAEAIVRSGGRLVASGEEERGLEEVYLSLIGGAA